MAKLMIEGGATVSGTDYTLRDVTRMATSNTKMTEVFSGSILGGKSAVLDVTKVKRYLQISVRTYYNFSTFVIDTAGRNVVYGGSTEMSEDGPNSYYTVGVNYNRTTGMFTVDNIGYFQINSTSYTSRNNNGAYCVYKIDTFDETYMATTELNPTNYSTGEVAIGTWIDGRTIYRKVLHNVLFSADSTATAMGISNLSKVLKVEGMINEHPINFYVDFSGTAYFSSCWVYGNDLYTRCSTSYAGSTDITIEYTKTT